MKKVDNSNWKSVRLRPKRNTTFTLEDNVLEVSSKKGETFVAEAINNGAMGTDDTVRTELYETVQKNYTIHIPMPKHFSRRMWKNSSPNKS